MHEKEAFEHKKMEANTPSDQMWDAFDHMCHAEAHMLLANHKRRGLSEMYKFKTDIKKRFWNVLELSEGKYDPVSESEKAHLYNTFEHFLKKYGYPKPEDRGDGERRSYIGHSKKEKTYTMLSGEHYIHGRPQPATGDIYVRPASDSEIEYSSTTRKDSASLMSRNHGYKGHRFHIHYKGDLGERHEVVNSVEEVRKVLERWHKAHHMPETINENNLNEIETKNKIHFVSPWNDELEDLDYSKTIARTHKIENDGRKNIKKRFGSQVRKQVRARKAKEDSESISRMLRSLFPNTRG